MMTTRITKKLVRLHRKEGEHVADTIEITVDVDQVIQVHRTAKGLWEVWHVDLSSDASYCIASSGV